MNKFYLLSGKFTAARLPEVFVPRHALLQKFHGAADKRVIFVSAPAGYGKTVSALAWLAGSKREIIWINLDAYDNTPLIFYKLFCTGILSIQPENKAMARILKSSAFASSPVEHTISFLSEFRPDATQYALVLDDMHLIINEEIRKSILYVQRRLPVSFVMVFLTRNEISEEFASTVGKGYYSIITERELALSTEEIQKYFNAHGHIITMAEAQAVHDMTEGWAIGVNALAMSGQTELGQSGGWMLEDYINTQIWDKWDSELRMFMLQTAVVDSLTAELADRLTGGKNSYELLETLCAKNLFLRHVGKDTYCYHPLFLDFLRKHQEKGDETVNRALYKKAADYFLEKNDFHLAMRYSIKSGNAEIIFNSSYALMCNNGSIDTIDEYVNFYKNLFADSIPDYICRQHPYLYTTYVWYYFIIGNAPKMEYYLDMLYEYLPAIIQEFSEFAEIAMMMTATDHRVKFSNWLKKFHLNAAVPKPDNQLQATSITMQMPYLHRSIRDFCELSDPEILEKHTKPLGVLLKQQHEVFILVLRSGFLYERNRLKEAHEIAIQAKNAINEEVSNEVIFCNFVHLASIYWAMGNAHAFADIAAQTEQYIEKSGCYYFRTNFAAFKTKMLLTNGDKTAAKAWLDNYFVVETEQFELNKIFRYFITARAYAALSQTDKALSYIYIIKKLGTDFNRPVDLAEANILHAILEWAQGNKTEALVLIEAALISMQSYGYVRVFAVEGASVLNILRRLATNYKKSGYETSLDPKFLNEVIIAAYEQSRRRKGLAVNLNASKPVKLSKQQKNIIILLSKGYKNAEIAEMMGLSIHTIKSHCSASYAKLDVNNAIDAVLKAKELGLIE